jgi:hypothetical protein
MMIEEELYLFQAIGKVKDVQTMTKVGQAAWPTLACVNNGYLSNLVNCISYQLSQDAYSRRRLISPTWSHADQT